MEKIIGKSLARLEHMTDSNGLVQHSDLDKPNPVHDYSIDDQARALIVLSRFSDEIIKENLAETYLGFITQAQRVDGWFNNYKKTDGSWKGRDGKTENPDTLQDCYGRALWGLSRFLSSKYSSKLKAKAKTLFFNSLYNSNKLIYPHSLAFGIIGLSKLPEQNRRTKRIISELSRKLVDIYSKDKESWMTYCVARIPQAMILAGKTLYDEKTEKIGKESLDLVIDRYFDADGMFHAQKNLNGDEQPIEAGVMAEVCIDAYKVTKEDAYLKSAADALRWFGGENSGKVNMLAENGGVYDSITKRGVNLNQGAESLLAYLMAVGAIRK